MRGFTLYICLISLLFSCSEEKKEKNSPIEKGAAEELEGTYSFDAESTQIIWNGFKATDKIKVVGQFKEFDSSRIGKQYASIEDLVTGLDFVIYTSSSQSGDPLRDLNLKDYFFNQLTSSFQLSGTLGVPKDGLIPVTFNTWIGEKTVSLEFFVTKKEDLIKIQGTLDIEIDLDGLLAFGSIHEKCEELHKGGDGASKTWSDVEVLIKVPIIRE